MTDALDRDTALLESLLGDVLEEQEGRAFRDRVFWLRDTAARLRDGDQRAGDEIADGSTVRAADDGAGAIALTTVARPQLALAA